jgi:peptidoglycan hydrolase-like protein with peptidoglycan-binding domain
MALIRLTKPLMYGSEIKKLQELLISKGYDPGVVDGYYGRRTQGAVISFQKDYKLLVDGIVGPQTWKALQNAENFYEVRSWTQKYNNRVCQYHALILVRAKTKMEIIHGQEISSGMFKPTILSAMPFRQVRMSGPLFWDGRPLGASVLNGKVVNDTPNYPNQYLSLSTNELMLFKNLTALQIANLGYRNVFSGTPQLVYKGQLELGKTDSYLAQIHPRAGIGWNSQKIILIVAEGRRAGSQGAYLDEFAREFIQFKADYAVNLDGGGSAELMLGSKILNNLSDGKERPLVWGLCFSPIG